MEVGPYPHQWGDEFERELPTSPHHPRWEQLLDWYAWWTGIPLWNERTHFTTREQVEERFHRQLRANPRASVIQRFLQEVGWWWLFYVAPSAVPDLQDPETGDGEES